MNFIITNESMPAIGSEKGAQYYQDTYCAGRMLLAY